MMEYLGRTLPSDWEWTPLEALGSWAGGGTPSKSNAEFWSGHIPWVSPKDMKALEIFDSKDHITQVAIAQSSTSLFPIGAVLIVTRSGILKHSLPVAVLKVPAALNQDLKALIPYEEHNPKFIAYSLRAFAQRILQECAKDGTTVQSLETPLLRGFKIPIPPRPIQDRIVDEVDELLSDLDSGVASLHRTQQRLGIYRSAVLRSGTLGGLTPRAIPAEERSESGQALVSRALSARRERWEALRLARFEKQGQLPAKDWKSKYREPVLPNLSGLPELPPNWTWASLDQIAEVAGGVTKGQKRRADAKVRAVPYLRVANVQRGYLDLSELKEIPATEEEISELALQPGDLLFNEGGDRDKLGRGWIWEGQVDLCIHQNHVFRARLVLPELQPRLVSWWGNSFGQLWFQNAGKQSVNLASINLTVLRSFPVPIAPATEQLDMVDVLEEQISVIDHLEADLRDRCVMADSLRSSLLLRAANRNAHRNCRSTRAAKSMSMAS